MQPIDSAAGNAAKSMTKKSKFLNEALRCFLSCFCVTVEDSDEEDDEPLDQPRRREQQAEEPLIIVGRPSSPLGVAGHQSPKCPAGEGGEERCPVDSPCSSTSSSDVEQASLESKDEEESETLSSEQSSLFMSSLESAEDAAEQPISTSSSDEEEENPSSFSKRVSDILANIFDEDQSEISSRSTTCTTEEEEENLSKSNNSVSDVPISLGSTDEDPEIYFSWASDTKQEEQAEEPSAIVIRPGSPCDTCPVDSPCSSTSNADVEQASLGSTDEEDPEMVSSCVNDTQQEEQAEEPLIIVGRPGSPLGVAYHQSPVSPAGEGGEDTCPLDSPCSFTSNADVEQASLGSTDEEDPEIHSSCVSDTEQEEQAEEPSARVHQPGSPLGVTGHQSPKCPALVGEVDTCPVGSLCSSTSSSDVEQASLGSTDEEDPEMVSFCVSETHQEEQAEEPPAIVDRPDTPLGVAGHQISTSSSDEEEENPSSLTKRNSDILATLKVDAGCDVAAVTTPPRAPVERLLKALNYVVSRNIFEIGRTLTPDELACYGLPNLSQTCFMNSVLQSLLTPMPFVKELNKQSHQWRSHPKALLFKLLTDINNCFTTKNSMQKKSTLFTFLRTIALHHPDFIKDEQQDAHEFLNTVLEQLSSVSTELRSMATDKEQSYTCPVEAHISFQMLSTMLCHSCGHKSENVEECLNLSVAPEDTIMQGIQLYLKEQLLDYKCDCGASQTTEQRSFFTLPNVLIIHLLRFKWSYFAAQKIHKATCLSRELLLHTNQSSEKTKYTLKSIVNHLGSCTTSGHYICDGVYRNASQGDGNACWVTYDDDIVKETTFNHVCQQRQKTAYLLYYEKN